MLNLPIVNLFFKTHPWLHDAKKKPDVVLKIALCVEFNCHGKKYDKYNILECFLKLDVWATLYILLWQCSNSNRFCHFYRKHTVCFQDFVHSLSYSRNMHKYHSYACGASNIQIYNILYYLLSAKDLSYYPLLLTCCSVLSNITCWYLKLLCNVLKTHLLALQY